MAAYLKTALRYYHTLKHLKPIQVIYRLKNRFFYAAPSGGQLPLRPRSSEFPWVEPITKPASWLGHNKFRFLNQPGEVCSAQDWNQPEQSKLWLYNLHYFDYLNQDNPPVGSEIIDRWIVENPVGQGNGWEPYPLSLRIVNWIKHDLAGNELSPEQRFSLVMQVRYLRRRLEYHLLANHLLANAKALVFAGVYFAGPEADEWLRKGLKIYRTEIPEQILPDGGHFERSPMYHAIILEDLLDVWNILRTADDKGLESAAFGGWIDQLTLPRVVERMLGWLGLMIHPDKRIALFNDAAFGIAPIYTELTAYCSRLGLPERDNKQQAGGDGMHYLPASGYARMEKGAFTLIADVGEVGPDYQPGHAHADTLSFELSIENRRILVDSGTSCYGVGPERLRQRRTAAHNTISVDEQDSSEVWSGHRVARRARIVKVEQSSPGDVDGDAVRLSAAHDGFKRLRTVGEHGRTWELTENKLTVTDRIEGRGIHRVETALHLHPELQAEVDAAGKVWISCLGGGRLAGLEFSDCLRVEVEEGTYHPEFGVSQATQRITGRYEGPLPVVFQVRLENLVKC